MTKNKFNAKRIYIDGEAFDSKKEYRRYCELKLLEKAGEISNLERQVEYELIPAQFEMVYDERKGGYKKGKCLERKCCYIADFRYSENGKTVVEDVKGYKNSGAAWSLYSIKRKLMLQLYGIRIVEV